MDWFALYDNQIIQHKIYLIECYDCSKLIATIVTEDIKEVEKIKKVNKKCKVVEYEKNCYQSKRICENLS